MALAVFSSFVFGLSKLIRIVGLMGPFIIGFVYLLQFVRLQLTSAIFEGNDRFFSFEDTQPAGSWWLSGILYAAYNMVSSAGFLMALGKDARSAKRGAGRRDYGRSSSLCYGDFMNLAMMSGLPRGEKQAVPSLVLAENVSPFASGIFIFVLPLRRVFYSGAGTVDDLHRSFSMREAELRLSSHFVTLDAFLLGRLPFDKLIAVIYPFAGYLGIFPASVPSQVSDENRRRQ